VIFKHFKFIIFSDMENNKTERLIKKTVILINFGTINNHIIQISIKYTKIKVLKTQVI
jgi:hypothetical protein